MQKLLIGIVALGLLVGRLAAAGVVNGDFSSGNTGFSSSYTYVISSPTVGNYTVTSNPQNFNAGLFSFGDHTTGSGQMMVIDGYQPGVVVWNETVTVTPQTNYSFSGWFRATWGGNVAQIVMTAANGPTNLGSLTPTAITDTQWTQLALNFNSGSASSVTLSFTDQNANYLQTGDDFAADDLALAPVPAPEPASIVCLATGLVLLSRRR